MTERPILGLQLLAVSRFVVLGSALGSVFGYLNYLIIGQQQPETTIGWGVIAGFMIGATVGCIEVFVFFGRMRRASYVRLSVLRTLVYSATFVTWLTVGNAFRVAEARDVGLLDAAAFYVLGEDRFIRDFLFTVTTAIIFIWILQAAQLQRGRDVFNFVLGKYHRPQEVESVFLFVDLTSSTTMAERLGHLTYSAFLQDFFYDVNMAVLVTRGGIYQYVGDEVIVTWPLALGTDKARCVECFFAILDRVEANKKHYLEQYGLYPRFRGGLHGGPAVVTWVGEIKKEIVYHGDVLNTAARIQAEAKGGPYECLISGELLGQMKLPEQFAAEPVGEVELRGKEDPLPLFGLARRGRPPTQHL